MSRDNSTFKDNYNRALDLVGTCAAGQDLPSELDLSKGWNTSRTTVRAILAELDKVGIIDWSGRRKTVLRAPRREEYYPSEETTTAGLRLTAQFMDYILTGDLAPGTALRESDLVTRFSVSSTVVREFLIRFSRFGLIEKEPNRHWVLRGFTRSFALEMFEVREMFEWRAFEAFLGQGADSEAHAALLSLRPDHEEIAADLDRYLEFPRLDERFHRVWIDRMENRFVTDFFEMVAMVFHYHYLWNKSDERERNHEAVVQHLRVIDAVSADDPRQARAAFADHLDHARETLLASVRWEEGA